MVSFQGLRFHDRTPVYQQVAEYLKRQILLGTVQDGDPMPSRRELAAQTGINPNTAQKAYRLMTEEGYVRTEGNNVSTVCLTPQRRAWIEDQLTRGLGVLQLAVEVGLLEVEGGHVGGEHLLEGV